MKTHVIQLDRHDDTTSVIDKINGSKAARILLVWPRRGRVLNNMLDLLLIQRASQYVGAQLACVADDDDVLDNAQDLGIPVFRSSKVAEKIPWRRIRKKKVFEPHTIHPASYFEKLKSDFKPNHPAWWEMKVVRRLAFTIGIAAVLGLLVFLLPGATVNLAFAVEKQSVALQVWASPDLQTVNLSGGIPASLISTIVEGQKTINTTGAILLPDQSSTGQVIFTNLTDQRVVIPAGTMVQNTREPVIKYRTLQAATLASQPGAQVEVGVQAVQAGSQGNIRTGEIRAVIGSLGTQVSVINTGAITGGRDVTSPAASQSDLDHLRDQIMLDLPEIALKYFEEAKTSGNRLLPQTLQMVKIQEEIVEPAFGLPASEIQMTLRVEYQVWNFREVDLETIAQAALDATLDPEKRPLKGSYQATDIQLPTFENGQVRWKVNASQSVQTAWDSKKIIQGIAGRTTAAAQRNLVGLPGLVGPAHISLTPAWWPVIPLLPARIEVVVR